MAKCFVWLVVVCLCDRFYSFSCYGHYERIKAKKSKLSDLEGKVVGGVEVPIELFPYIAQLSLKHGHFCMGSVISARVIITAAHCIEGLNDNGKPKLPIDVYLGSDRSLEGARYSVCRLVQHEKYGIKDASTEYYLDYAYDIGLLLLDRKITLNNVVKIIPIAPNWHWRNFKSKFTVAGFGQNSDTGKLSKELKVTWMRYVDSELCNRTIPDDHEQMLVPDNMFCMIGEKWTSDCNGDSGSGIVWKGYLVGLVALGRATFCGSDTVPSMYTDVVFFRSWVDRHVRDLESNAHRTCNNNYKLKDDMSLKPRHNKKKVDTCELGK